VWHSKWVAVAALVAPLFLARPAAADVSLVEKDGWEVFLNGRIQTFANYNEGKGRPVNGTTLTSTDGNNGSVEVRGGGLENLSEVLPEYQNGVSPTAADPGLIREMRIRSGFTGNVIGFGIRRRLSERTDILGYTAVTVGIDSEERRKFNVVSPDWRESFLRVTSFWGSLTAGRTLTLFSRGATEITYLYGYRYGLGFPGSVSNFSQSTAGSVGFGVLGNGFGAGLAYATPSLGGLTITVGAYDANQNPRSTFLNRSRWPRGEAEIVFLKNFGATGLVKLFANGAFQRVYDFDGRPLSVDMYGTGFGGRFEMGPVKIGLAGHWGKGVGVTYSLEPHLSVYFDEAQRRALGDATSACGMGVLSACPGVKMRTVDGAYAQTQIAVVPSKLDVRAGFGITRVHQLDEDRVDWKNDDMDANTPTGDDDAMPGVPDSVGHITIRQQWGAGGGLTWHVADNLHFTVEYFRAFFQWYKPVPAAPGQPNPSQALNAVNAGLTYDF
jgi:hypothetical protein